MSTTLAFIKWQNNASAPVVRNVTRTPDRLENSSKPLDPVWPRNYTLLVPSHSSGGSEPSLLHLLKVESSQRMGQEVHLQLHGIAHWMKVLADD